MYFINYDFYDIYALIVFFRSYPERFLHYRPAVQKIMEYIEKTAESNALDYNNIRKILKEYYDENDKFLSWVTVENQYTANIRIIKKEAVYRVLLKIMCEMTEYYTDKDRFYLLCDAVHNIPLVLADDAKPKKAINVMIQQYRKKYNNLFLKEELRLL